jgi:alpha-glucoside transport system permease protein
MTTRIEVRQRKTNRIYAAAFVLPALAVLGAFVLYPALKTIYDSFFGRFGDDFVGLDNYRQMFEFDRMRRAIVNSFLWTAIFPVLVTTVGLVLAVLADKIRWKTAFKLVLFLPIAIAVMSSGIIWRIVYDTSPDRGLLNAAINVPVSLFSPEGDLAGAVPSLDTAAIGDDRALRQSVEVGPEGAVSNIGLVRVPVEAIPASSVQAAALAPAPGTVRGVLWRDTKPGQNEKGVVEPDEAGLPGVGIKLVSSDGSTVANATSGPDGGFEFTGVAPGAYQLEVSASAFREAWGGVSWLGPDLVTPAAIIAGLWIWAGFALVVIGAGLASLDQAVLEAARVDGAGEWQVFRRVTLPLLAPVLGVVFVTLTINALKMFDLIVGIAPGSVQDDANVIALEMWRSAFTGLGDRGLGSAIAVFLFVLILPVMALNIRRFQIEEGRR